MRIIIALKGYFTAGDIFFETPDESELNRITEEIITICTDHLHKIYGDNKLAAKRLEEKSIRMRAVCSSIEFASIKEIVDLSGELGFPIRVMGEPEGSLFHSCSELPILILCLPITDVTVDILSKMMKYNAE